MRLIHNVLHFFALLNTYLRTQGLSFYILYPRGINSYHVSLIQCDITDIEGIKAKFFFQSFRPLGSF